MTDVPDLFDRLTAGLPDTSPAPGLALAGRRVRRRRRQRVVLATAAAVAVLAASSAVAADVVRGDRTAEVASASPTPSDPTGPTTAVPAPPPGMKWVGQDRTIVAVPVDWTVDETDCNASPVRPGSVGAIPTMFCESSHDASWTRVDVYRAGEHEVSDGMCLYSYPAICDRQVVVGGIAVRAQSRGMHNTDLNDRILDSVTTLPDGWTTVPFAEDADLDERVAAYEAAGFTVEVEDRDRISGTSVTAEPALGAPIEDGGTITLSPAVAPSEVQMYADPTMLEPGQELDAVFVADVTRGLAYALVGDDGERYLLTSGSNGGDPAAYGPGQGVPVDDIGFMGRGRDRLVLPDDAPPGRYRLCSEDERACSWLTITR